MKTLLIILVVLTAMPAFAQWELKPKGSGQGGTVSLGIRNTWSLFNDANTHNHTGDEELRHYDGFSQGLGGQFRIQASNRVNTEWFFDYLPGGNELVKRTDYHIGWSVMFYVLENPNPLFRPYILGGHCFDYTSRSELADRTNAINRWSGAVQMGLGTHIRLTSRFDLSLSSQYMMHLGTHVETNYDGHDVVFEKSSGGSLEGHLLTTLSLNFKLFDVW